MSFGVISLGSISLGDNAPLGGTTPTIWVFSSTSAAFRAGSLFSLASTSTTQFETPFRSFAIPSASVTAFVTDQRAFAIDTSSTALFRVGAQMQVQASSSLDYNISIPRYGDYAINTLASGAFVGAKWVDTEYSVKSSSRFAPGRGYIKGLSFVARTATTTEFKRAYTGNLAFSVVSGAVAEFGGSAVKERQFSIASTSALAAGGRAFVPSSHAISTSSQTSFLGVKGALAAGVVLTSSDAAFVSAYTYAPITPIPTDVDAVYAAARNNSVFVLSA